MAVVGVGAETRSLTREERVRRTTGELMRFLDRYRAQDEMASILPVMLASQ